MHDQALVVLFTTLAVGTKVGIFIATPLYVDSLNGNSTHCTSCNHRDHNGSTSDSTKQIDPMFLSLSQALFFTIAFGVLLLAIVILSPAKITDVERNFPKRYYVITGAANGVSSLMLNYAISGTRTPSYLLALLGNFMVPSQFIIR